MGRYRWTEQPATSRHLRPILIFTDFSHALRTQERLDHISAGNGHHPYYRPLEVSAYLPRRRHHILKDRRGPFWTRRNCPTILLKEGMCLRLDKYKLLYDQVNYLGHNIFPGTLGVSAKAFETVKNLT